MIEINLDQETADAFIALPKIRANNEVSHYPGLGGYLSLPLLSEDGRESFHLDVRRGGIDLSKGTYQNRAMQVVILVRLDFGGAPHRNPDDEEIPAPHLHIYREGYGDKWAIPAPLDKFPDLQDLWTTLQDFMNYWLC
ncbi:MAG: DUF6978 family protein [Methanomicrobiales archaeon]